MKSHDHIVTFSTNFQQRTSLHSCSWNALAGACGWSDKNEEDPGDWGGVPWALIVESFCATGTALQTLDSKSLTARMKWSRPIVRFWKFVLFTQVNTDRSHVLSFDCAKTIILFSVLLLVSVTNCFASLLLYWEVTCLIFLLSRCFACADCNSQQLFYEHLFINFVEHGFKRVYCHHQSGKFHHFHQVPDF